MSPLATAYNKLPYSLASEASVLQGKFRIGLPADIDRQRRGDIFRTARGGACLANPRTSLRLISSWLREVRGSRDTHRSPAVLKSVATLRSPRRFAPPVFSATPTLLGVYPIAISRSTPSTETGASPVARSTVSATGTRQNRMLPVAFSIMPLAIAEGMPLATNLGIASSSGTITGSSRLPWSFDQRRVSSAKPRTSGPVTSTAPLMSALPDKTEAAARAQSSCATHGTSTEFSGTMTWAPPCERDRALRGFQSRARRVRAGSIGDVFRAARDRRGDCGRVPGHAPPGLNFLVVARTADVALRRQGGAPFSWKNGIRTSSAPTRDTPSCQGALEGLGHARLTAYRIVRPRHGRTRA